MYKLLKDKNNEFQCEIRLEGASSKDATARLFLEADGCEYVFAGHISGETCTIPMGKLKKFANLLESGKIRLEIIAEDTVFVPYESDYQLEQEKKVTVEVKQPTTAPSKPLVEVSVKQQPVKAAPKLAPVQKVVEKPAPLMELKNYLKMKANFDGTQKSFRNIIQNKVHRSVFNAVCEAYNLDKKVALQEILK